MARRLERQEAITLRNRGLSYSQIKNKLGINKSTLSYWLRDMPLSKGRIRELQFNEAVIEKIRATKLKKRETRLSAVLDRFRENLGDFSDREILISGFFLYWAEGGKTRPYTVVLANTDPAMIRFYLRWLTILGAPVEKSVIRLHLYSDMDVEKEMRYWSKVLDVPKNRFRKPYIKKSKFSSLTFSTFGHGTCNVILHHRDTAEYILQGLKRLASLF